MRVSNPQIVRRLGFADWKSAIQQVGNLRYGLVGYTCVHYETKHLVGRSANALTNSWTQRMAGEVLWRRFSSWTITAFHCAKRRAQPVIWQEPPTHVRYSSPNVSFLDSSPATGATRARHPPLHTSGAPPLLLRYPSVAPLINYERCYGGVTEEQRRGCGGVCGRRRRRARGFRASTAADSRYVGAFMRPLT